jgi:MFS family permease
MAVILCFNFNRMVSDTIGIKKMKRIKEQHQGIATILAFGLLPLSGFATDIYIPSLPNMAATLHVGSIHVQLTLTIFLISYGISQLFVGSLLDVFGRYRLGLLSMLIFAIASVVIATTHNLYLIYGMRVIHGITVGTIIVGKRAYFVDLFTGNKLKNYLTMFSIIWSTGPIVAPFIGGYLQTAFGWESNFYLLAGLALVLALLEFIFGGETLPQATTFQVRRIAGIYAGMLRTTTFTLGIFMLGLAYAMVMVYNMTGPFIIEHHLQLSAVTAGYSSLVLGFAWMAGGFISKATINRPFFRKLTVNSGLQVLFALLMLVSVQFVDNLYSLLFFAFIIHACSGYTFNNYFTYCLSSFPANAGIASGLTGGLMYIVVSIMSYGVVFLLPAKDQHHLNASYLLLIGLSVFIMGLVLKLRSAPVTAQPA